MDKRRAAADDDVMLETVLSKLTPPEQEWVMRKIAKRPAHRPKTPARIDGRRDIFDYVEVALHEGKMKKMAIGEAAKIWGASERTVLRRYDAEARRRDNILAGWKRTKKSLVQKGFVRVLTITRRLTVK